jgi:glycosyltransferase involved in cell wall biosynthesis
VLHVGIDLAGLVAQRPPEPATPLHLLPPLILWNQRWEYDKNPAAFFEALYQLVEEGYRFRLALCGQQYGRQPPAFSAALERLSDYIVHSGYANIIRYRQLLWEAAVTVSTAEHEFFGISILEAIAAHTFPLLPNRLSYPELLPVAFHNDCLYESHSHLVERLRWALTHTAAAQTIATQLAATVERFSWQRLAAAYDAAVADLDMKSRSN